MGSTITIDFHGDPLAAILDDDRVLVPLRPLVVGMGLDWASQLQRVKRSPILGPAVVMTTTTPVAMTATREPSAVCLPLDLVPGFLFGVDASRVAEAVRPKVLDYQRECFRVLADACLGPAGLQRTTSTAEILPPGPITTPDPKLCLRMVTECRSTFGVQPARELWFTLGLPRVPGMARMPLVDLFVHAEGRPGGQA